MILVSSTYTRLFSEMLYEIQRNDGKLGTYLVGEMSGGIYDQIDLGRGICGYSNSCDENICC